METVVAFALLFGIIAFVGVLWLHYLVGQLASGLKDAAQKLLDHVEHVNDTFKKDADKWNSQIHVNNSHSTSIDHLQERLDGLGVGVDTGLDPLSRERKRRRSRSLGAAIETQ